MKYAIVESGGKQYKAVEGEAIDVDRLPGDPGDELSLESVLMLVDGESVNVGKPVVMSAPATPVGMTLEDLVFRVSKDEQRKHPPEHPTSVWQRVTKRLAQKK